VPTSSNPQHCPFHQNNGSQLRGEGFGKVTTLNTSYSVPHDIRQTFSKSKLNNTALYHRNTAASRITEFLVMTAGYEKDIEHNIIGEDES